MIVFIILFQAALLGAHSQLSRITAYVNDTVVLPSGAAASEVLTGIEWSIFPNNIIATYSEAGVYVEWRNEFKGRLSLDASSGNLTISKVRRSDSMVYNVERIIRSTELRVHKVNMSIRNRLQKPAVSAVGHSSSGGRCFALLQCSSPDDGVSLSWRYDASAVSAFNQEVGRDVLLLAIINQTQGDVQISCTASMDSDHASDTVSTDCTNESRRATTSHQPSSQTPLEEKISSRSRTPLVASFSFFFGALCGSLLVTVLLKHQSRQDDR